MLYQVVLRLGWIFKTESIVMPAVLDSIGGTATLRGLLPMLSRFGLAIPPLFVASQIRLAKYKKRPLALFTGVMGGLFLVLAACWLVPREKFGGSLPAVYLVIYTMFFVASGLHQISFGTLQGKVIPATNRGRLLFVYSLLGAFVAITAVLVLMPDWLRSDGGAFHLIFGFSGVCFVVAAFIALCTQEHASPRPPEDFQPKGIRQVLHPLYSDKNLQLTALVSALCNSSIMLYPHYQALARDRLDLDFTALMTWVVVQNAGTAFFSSLAGPIADRYGNRLVLRFIAGGLALIPLLALLLSKSANCGATLFSCVFFLVGLSPVLIRVMQHYTLEICDRDDHPQYLAAISLANAAPFFLSGLIGYGVGRFDFDSVFVVISSLAMLACLLTFWLREPRTQPRG